MESKLSFYARTNRLVLILVCIINALLAMGNFIEAFNGYKTFPSAILALIVNTADVCMLCYIYLKNKESKFFREFSFWGFLVVYFYSLFSSYRVGVYVYIIPHIFLYFLSLVFSY